MINQAPDQAPKIEFTNLYRLIDICDIDRDGIFSRDWNGSYKTLDTGKSTVNVPANDGSQILLRQMPLKPLHELPSGLRDIIDHKEALYLVTSKRYSIHYVGMTAGGIPGVFKGGGRFSHHARKILASVVNTGTNHTGGWLDHARDRYKDLVNEVEHGKEPTDEDLLGDIVIAFGVSEGDWSSEEHEGVAEDYFRNRLTEIKGEPSRPMNRKRTSRKPAAIAEPNNLEQVIAH